MRYRTRTFVILLIGLLFIGCGRNEIVGHITGPDGKPVQNIKVFLCVSPGSDSASAAARSVTDGKGAFRIKTKYRGDAVLEILGERGEGRVRVNTGSKRTSIDITYPVIEKVIFLHDNDLHFDFNSIDAFGAKLKEIRSSNDDVFLLNAGDVFVRHPSRWIVDGIKMDDPAWYGQQTLLIIDIMNRSGYDLMTLGNHELGYIEPYTRAALETAQFPLLAANIEVTTDAIPPVESYKILSTSTWRTIAVLGLTTVSNPGDSVGITLIDPIEVTGRYVHLADENDVFVVLSHIGYSNDKKLALRFPQIDIIIGGHSHTFLENAEIVNTVLVAQAGGSEHVMSKDHEKYLGEIVVTMENGMITDKQRHVMIMPLP